MSPSIQTRLSKTVRSSDELDPSAGTVSQLQREFRAGEHYCNSPLKPITGSEG